MTTSTILENVSTDDLKILLQNIVRDELAAIKPTKEEGFITRKELGNKLHLSLVSIDKHIKEGRIKGYRMGGRVLFKESEIILLEIPIRKHK